MKMLNTIIDKNNGIVILQPHGTLKKEDFDKAVKVIDPFIEEYGKLNGIIIYTELFPGWEDYAALSRHMVFIKNHHKKIKKLAFVTDSMIGNFGELISSHFVSAEIKSFDFNQIEDAKTWILE
jgi:hypothetical protein